MCRGAGKRSGREGRVGAQGGTRRNGCRCGVDSVTGGKCEDPGNDPGHSDPGIRTVCAPRGKEKTEYFGASKEGKVDWENQAELLSLIQMLTIPK